MRKRNIVTKETRTECVLQVGVDVDDIETQMPIDIDRVHRAGTSSNLPIVEINVVLKASSEKRKRTHVFPTPLSPIRRSLKRRSYAFLFVAAILIHPE